MESGERARWVEYLLVRYFKGRRGFSAWLLTHSMQHVPGSPGSDLQRAKDGIDVETTIRRKKLEALADGELQRRYLEARVSDLEAALKDADAKSTTLERENSELQIVAARASTLQREKDEATRAALHHWPWGEYETELLRKLADAAGRYWTKYDPSDPTTADTNETVAEWLISQGVSKRVSEVMAQILRVNGLRTGPR